MTSVSGIVFPPTESPPFVSGLANLYKYEPFTYQYSASPGYTFSNLVTSPEILAFTTTTSSNVTFSSVSGYQISYSNTFPLSFQTYSNGILRGTYSNNFRINPGRFFPPVFGASNTFYVNEPITPISFNTSAAVSSVFANPTMIPGLTFSNVGGVGTQWVLQGTPLAQVPTTAYQIIGASGSRIVTTSNTYTVLGERVRLFANNVPTVCNVPLAINLTVSTPIVSNVITAALPGTSSFVYVWNSLLPNGLEFADSLGNTVSSSPFAPTDPSYTIILRGTPTVAAAKSFVAANISNYTVTLGAFQSRPGGAISNILPLQFSFGETVLFNADPYSNLLYVDVSLNQASNISFKAATYFSSPVNISSILSPDLRSDLSINFNVGTQTAYLVSSNGPTSVASNTFTLRAINSNNITCDASLTIQTINDVVTWDTSITPATDACYNFIVPRPLSSAKPGYYPYPIQFKATSAAGMPITYSATGFAGTTITLSTNAILQGIPLNSCALTTATITATAANTGVTNTRDISYAILDDVISLSATPALPTLFRQNVAMTPVKITATALSGFQVSSFSVSGLPTGVYLTSAAFSTPPTATMAGTPTTDLSGAYSITASTSPPSSTPPIPSTSQTISVSYSIVPDTVLFMTDSNRYYIPPGSNVPADMMYMLSSFSGLTPSNAAIAAGNPTQFGVLMDSTGAFSGTMSTNIAPNPVLPQYPQWIPFNVSAQAGLAYGDTTFYMSAFNADGARRYFSAGNPPSCNILYYSTPTDLCNAPQSVVDSNYQNWFSGLTGYSTDRVTDVAVRYIDTSHSTVIVCVNDGTGNGGAVLRSTNGIDNFSNTFFLQGAGIIKTINLSNDYWAGAGFSNGNPHLFTSSNDGDIGWTDVPIPNLKTRAGTSTAYEAQGLFIARYGTGIDVVIGGGQYTTGGAETVVITTSLGFVSRSFAMPGEVAGALIPQSNQELYYGSDTYLTANGAPGTFVDASTMVAVVSGSAAAVPGQFNFFCYDVRQAASNLFVATGVQHYGGGYVPEVRVSSDIFGPYTVTDLSATGTLFSPSATPPKPNIGYGPMFSDASYVFMPVTTGGTTRIYRHDLQAPPLTNWISISSTLGNIDITETASVPFVTNTKCLPFVDFGNDLGLPTPVFTAPTQKDYLFYQYVGITPITVSAVPAVGGGAVYLMASKLPPGFSFDGFTGLVTGIPTQLGPQVAQFHAHDISWNTYSTLNLNFDVVIPRIVRKQDGAGAYTSFLRQYTEVNAAQNARDNRVLPGQEQKLGAFAAPEGPDVVTQTVDPRCFDPNACN